MNKRIEKFKKNIDKYNLKKQLKIIPKKPVYDDSYFIGLKEIEKITGKFNDCY